MIEKKQPDVVIIEQIERYFVNLPDNKSVFLAELPDNKK